MQKIIKLSDTHYIGVDDSEIKVGDIVAEKLLTGRYELFEIHTPNDIDEVRQKKVTHSNQPLGKPLFFTNAFESELSLSVNGLNDTVIENWGCKKLSLSEVEEAINGYSVDDGLKYVLSLPNSEYLSYGVQKMLEDAYNKGFNAHKELVKDKLFTIEQINEVIAEAWNSCEDNEGETYTQVHKRIIQSLLPKTEWECIIDEQGKLKLI